MNDVRINTMDAISENRLAWGNDRNTRPVFRVAGDVIRSSVSERCADGSNDQTQTCLS